MTATITERETTMATSATNLDGPMTIEPDVVVTPALARKWLALNVENNRNKRSRNIERWARDMAAIPSRWHLTAETVKFRRGDGKLIDGQNRLLALLEAELINPAVVIHMSVARNVDPDAAFVMDSGAARTFGDSLKFREGAERYINGAAVRWTMQWDRGNRMASGGNWVPSHAEMMEVYDGHHDLFDEAARRGADVRRANLGTASVWATAYVLFGRIDLVATRDFFDKFISGLGLNDDPQHPIVLLRNRMIRRSVARLKPREELALVIRAWNHYGRDGRIASLVISRDELSNKTFPVPVAPRTYADADETDTELAGAEA